MTETCGWLIKGDPLRPCAISKGHKDRHHRDALELAKRRQRNNEYQVSYSQTKRGKEVRRSAVRRYRNKPGNQKLIRSKQREHRRANPVKAREQARLYRTRNLEKYRAREAESARRRRAAEPEKFRAYDRNRVDLKRVNQREYRKAHPEQHRLYWRRHNTPEKQRLSRARRRARVNKAFHEDWTRAQVACLYGDYCYLCDGPYEHTDHVIPLFRGGWDVLPNLRPSCAPCNLRKSARMPALRDLVNVLLTMKVYLSLRYATIADRTRPERLMFGRESDR